MPGFLRHWFVVSVSFVGGPGLVLMPAGRAAVGQRR